MFSRMVVRFLVLGIFCSAFLLAQQKPAAPVPSGVQEFPMIMRQNVTASKTPVGTEVQVKLVVGTLGDGTVFPKNAIFSGKVIESVAKTSTEPSRLAIRMDSVQWKDGSAGVKIYLTAWYYPTTVATGQDLQYGRAAVSGQDLERRGRISRSKFTSGKAIFRAVTRASPLTACRTPLLPSPCTAASR